MPFRNSLKEDDIKVRDHCHYTGKYRGPAHRCCNLRYKIPNYIPIVFHNLNRFDAHLLGKKFNTVKIGVIAENKEKYISFNIDVVVDSYADNSGEVLRKRKSSLDFNSMVSTPRFRSCHCMVNMTMKVDQLVIEEPTLQEFPPNFVWNNLCKRHFNEQLQNKDTIIQLDKLNNDIKIILISIMLWKSSRR